MSKVTSCILLLAFVVFPGRTFAVGTDATTILTSLPHEWTEAKLEASINDGSRDRFKVGDRLKYSFRSSRDAYLTVINVDSHGVVTLLMPDASASSNQISAGEELSFPSEANSFVIEVQPPIGLQTLFVVATKDPVSLQSFGVAPGNPFVVIEPAEAESFAQRVVNELRSRPPTSVALARLDHHIARTDSYSAADIVDYFQERRRSIRRPKLDAHISFEFDSAELTPEAKLVLDEFGKALTSGLATQPFALGGHTDQRGTEDYNMDLSRRRAESAKRYLVEEHGVDAERLAVNAYGELEPLEPGETKEAWAANRRVVFEMGP